jgi:solute carrier family 5 (sodium-coupled monocarboxylate transporter), member 8/12
MYVIGGVLLTGVAMMYAYLPVFHGLQLTSTYQYLQTRFDKRMRLFGSVLFTIGSVSGPHIVI